MEWFLGYLAGVIISVGLSKFLFGKLGVEIIPISVFWPMAWPVMIFVGICVFVYDNVPHIESFKKKPEPDPIEQELVEMENKK